MGRLAQHADVGAGAEHALLAGGDHHGSHFRMLEAEALDRVVELDVHAQIVGVQLELVPRPEAAALVDVHRQRRHRPVEGELPVPVPRWLRPEIDDHPLACPCLILHEAGDARPRSQPSIAHSALAVLPPRFSQPCGVPPSRYALSPAAELVGLTIVVQGDLAFDHVEELHLTGAENDFVGLHALGAGAERRDHRPDLSLEEPRAQHVPLLRVPVERHDGVVGPASHVEPAVRRRLEQGPDGDAEGPRHLPQRVERRGEAPGLDLRQHARGEPRLLGKLPLPELALRAQRLDPLAEATHGPPLRRASLPAGAARARRTPASSSSGRDG